MANKAQYRDREPAGKGFEPTLVPLVDSTKQTHGLRDQNYLKAHEELDAERVRYGLREEQILPQIMGGGDIESGGDGSGFSGGVDLNYWEYWLANFDQYREMTGYAELAEGRDYPSPEQMEAAREFARRREELL